MKGHWSDAGAPAAGQQAAQDTARLLQPDQAGFRGSPYCASESAVPDTASGQHKRQCGLGQYHSTIRLYNKDGQYKSTATATKMTDPGTVYLCSTAMTVLWSSHGR
jgi:hypothetical protein